MSEAFHPNINELIPQTEEVISRYPELLPLATATSNDVPLLWGGKRYISAASSRGYGNSGEELIIGLWEVTDESEEPTPVAFSNPTITGSTATLYYARFTGYSTEASKFSQKYSDLATISKRPIDIGSEAFFVHEKYRQAGIGQLLNTLTLVTLEARGASHIRYSDDLTGRDDSESGPYSQFKTGELRQVPHLVAPAKSTSLYSKYSTDVSITKKTLANSGRVREVSYNTTASTHISGIQQSMLNEALGKYN